MEFNINCKNGILFLSFISNTTLNIVGALTDISFFREVSNKYIILGKNFMKYFKFTDGTERERKIIIDTSVDGIEQERKIIIKLELIEKRCFLIRAFYEDDGAEDFECPFIINGDNLDKLLAHEDIIKFITAN